MRQLSRLNQGAEILLAEDNKHDVILTQQALKQAGIPFHLHTVKNGVECMAFLRKEGKFIHAPTPDLTLLDLNMPMMDGREVLEAIASDPKLNHLPVVILTTSEDQADVYKMYRLRCSSYIVKPVDFIQFLHVVKKLCGYWFSIVMLPPN